MGFSDLLMRPFEKYFNPPALNTPVSTIKWPNIYYSTIVLFASFLIITSGTIFCFVNGMPMIGYRRNEQGQIIASWIDPNGLSSQYLAEGMIASMIFSLGAGSFITAFYLLRKKGKRTGVDDALALYAYSCPFWPILSFFVFQQKIPSYFPRYSVN